MAHSGRGSDRLLGVLRSRTFPIASRYIHYRVAGRGGRINVVVDGFEKIRSPIYGGLTTVVDAGDRFRWITQDVGMWVGENAYIEIADGAVADYGGVKTLLDDGRGYIAVDEIRFSDRRSPPGSPSPDRGESIDLKERIGALRRARPEFADLLEQAIDRYRSVDATIPAPRLALAVADGSGDGRAYPDPGQSPDPGRTRPAPFPRGPGR